MEPDLDNIQQLFSEMKAAGWDTAQPLKWGFFFLSEEKDNLTKIYDELKEYHYQLESLRQSDDGAWELEASKTEMLAAEKLHERNHSFDELATAYHAVYDGWDVEQDD